MSVRIGEAVIWLELDRTRGRLRVGDKYAVELTGWKRFLVLTRSLYAAGAQYDIHFDYYSKSSRNSVAKDTVILCARARLKATVAWVIQ